MNHISLSMRSISGIFLFAFLTIGSISCKGQKFITSTEPQMAAWSLHIVRPANQRIFELGYTLAAMDVHVIPQILTLDSVFAHNHRYRYLPEEVTLTLKKQLGGKSFHEVIYYRRGSIGGIVLVYVDAKTDSVLYVEDLG